MTIGGERGRNRTYNLVIKSHLLCQLSYAPAEGLPATWQRRPHEKRAARQLRIIPSRARARIRTVVAVLEANSTVSPEEAVAESAKGGVSMGCWESPGSRCTADPW
jgi:hypothetical protein